MRLIDADRFRAWVLKENETKWGETIEEILDAIDDCKTVDPVKQGMWIPCSERLPEEKKARYWVCNDNGSQFECRWTNANQVWTGLTTYWHWNIFDVPQYSKVVAWMPLQEPYEEKDDATD